MLRPAEVSQSGSESEFNLADVYDGAPPSPPGEAPGPSGGTPSTPSRAMPTAAEGLFSRAPPPIRRYIASFDDPDLDPFADLEDHDHDFGAAFGLTEEDI